MFMEERNTQQDREDKGKKAQSPNCNTFKTKLLSLANRAKQIHNDALRTLIHLVDKEWLYQSWRSLRKGATHGIDAVNAAIYVENLDSNLERLLYRMRSGQYVARPVRRVYIPKGSGKKRSLGIPTIEDKIVQNAIKYLLQGVFEQEFLPVSYGFRLNKSPLQAIEAVKVTIAKRKVSWVLDVDVASFFDNMNHEWLIKFVSHRIRDRRVLKYIQGWLKAGVMEDGKLIRSSNGSPQGGVISPVLANIYLHYVIDLWVKKSASRTIQGEMYNFRYADDLLFCFQYEDQAIKFRSMLESRLQKFGLALNLEKSISYVDLVDLLRKIVKIIKKEDQPLAF